jgi:hypothetical protein
MPKITGPLMSISARGTVAGTVNYRETKRGCVARVHSKPTGEATAKQLAIRAINKQVSQSWASVSTEERATWNELSESHNYSPFNAFFVFNFKRVLTGQVISNVYPPLIEPELPDISCTNILPSSDPNVEGDYEETGVYNDMPYYKRFIPSEFYLWFADGAWLISLELGNEGDGVFFKNTEQIEGQYDGQGLFHGSVLITVN